MIFHVQISAESDILVGLLFTAGFKKKSKFGHMAMVTKYGHGNKIWVRIRKSELQLEWIWMTQFQKEGLDVIARRTLSEFSLKAGRRRAATLSDSHIDSQGYSCTQRAAREIRQGEMLPLELNIGPDALTV